MNDTPRVTLIQLGVLADSMSLQNQDWEVRARTTELDMQLDFTWPVEPEPRSRA